MDLSALERIESFPYRHRVQEVMGQPLRTAGPQTRLGEAARLMAEGRVSSLVVVDQAGRPAGIVTERDVLKALAEQQSGAPLLPLDAVMSSPVATVRQDAFLYVAMGRMDRLKLRHLVAVDAQGRASGVVTVGGLLHLRAGVALALGDELTSAPDARTMAGVKARLPALARTLRAEGIEAPGVAAVISSAYRDMTMRAAQLAEDSMARDGWGEPPAPYCLLLLGSGGRRESLLGADQDNALVHEGGPEADAWFAELGRRLNQTLDQAGLPLCQGGVMAGNAAWRRSLEGWQAEIERWVREAEGPEILNVDIFVDARPVHGSDALAAALKARMLDAFGGSPRFLKMLADSTSGMTAPLGVLGQFKTREGRLDIKTSGLLPLVSAARTLALKHRIGATGTPERLRALAEGGHMPATDADTFQQVHALMLGILLDQQIADTEAGLPISNRIDPKRLSADQRSRLKDGFRSINSLAWLMGNALSTV